MSPRAQPNGLASVALRTDGGASEIARGSAVARAISWPDASQRNTWTESLATGRPHAWVPTMTTVMFLADPETLGACAFPLRFSPVLLIAHFPPIGIILRSRASLVRHHWMRWSPDRPSIVARALPASPTNGRARSSPKARIPRARILLSSTSVQWRHPPTTRSCG